jgi:hypothetical protein
MAGRLRRFLLHVATGGPDALVLLEEACQRSAIGRQAKLTDEECAILDQVRDKAPPSPVSFE